MKFYYYILILFVFGLSITNISAQSCILNFSANKLVNIDTSFQQMIDYHILSMKKRGVKHSENKLIFMEIKPAIDIPDGVPQQFIDSIYAYNDFTLKNGWFFEDKNKFYYPKVYIADIQTDYVSSFISLPMDKYKSAFYCKYHNWDIIIVSKLSIKMANEADEKTIEIKSSIKPDKNNMVWKLTNNHIFLSFYNDLNFHFSEFVIVPVTSKNAEQYRLNLCRKKVRKIKISSPCTSDNPFLPAGKQEITN